jgi:hypothetical protein
MVMTCSGQQAKNGGHSNMMLDENLLSESS